MSAAAAAILDGMPDARDLHRLDSGGQTVIFAGSRQLFRYPEDDTAMRNIAVAALRQLGYGGTAVAAVMGLTPNYVATLHQRALREGTAGLVREPGRPRETGEASWEQARAWRAAGARDSEIARRLGVNQSTVLRRLGRAHVQEALPPAPQPQPAAAEPEAAGSGAAEPGEAARTGPAEPGPRPQAGDLRPTAVSSRYAGAMLLHAFLARAGAGTVLAAAGGEPQDVALLTAVSMCFALGAATTEQFKHLAAAEAGPLAGPGALPGLRVLRPELARIADGTDPLKLQQMFASALLAADPVVSGVYYVDDHFVPYTGAKPVARGWNNKRGRAERGRADTHVTAHDGRAVCFVSGEPSGLSTTLPKALAELKKAAGPGAEIMLGFDRGGAYPQVFTHCRDQQVHWVTCRRAPLAVPAALPVITAVTYGGRTRDITWAEETVQLKDYGGARQITLFEHGRVALQILTSDTAACPADILSWLTSRWREENFLRYASENYGIDKICDYLASIETNTKLTRNPARDQANAAVRDAPVRRVLIPKPDGRMRPLGWASLEDKIVQRALAEVLNAVFEADFRGISYGFRPGRKPHDALDALSAGIYQDKVSWVLDADIRDFFGQLDRSWLERFLRHRIADERVLRLIGKWLAAGVIEDGKLSESEQGTPQGAPVSPLLANVYLRVRHEC